MYKYICETCGKSFEAPQKTRKYCSMACRQLPGAPKSFTGKQEEEICRLYTTPNEKGLYIGAGQIAQCFSVNPKTIHNILDRHGIEKRNKAFYVQNQPHHNLTRVPPADEAPPLCGCGCGQPVKWLQKKNRWGKYVKGHYTQEGRQNQRWAGGPITYTCPICGKDFEDLPNQSRSYCSVECQGIARRSPYYQEGTRWRKWDAMRRRIRQRDNWTCQDCGFYSKGIKRAIHVHHIDENPTNNSDENLVCLCPRCHLARHGCALPDDWEYDGVAF